MSRQGHLLGIIGTLWSESIGDALLTFVRESQRSPVNSPLKGSVMQSFDIDVTIQPSTNPNDGLFNRC